jgi:outer membrane lipoprotein-sorting protein
VASEQKQNTRIEKSYQKIMKFVKNPSNFDGHSLSPDKVALVINNVFVYFNDYKTRQIFTINANKSVDENFDDFIKFAAKYTPVNYEHIQSYIK